MTKIIDFWFIGWWVLVILNGVVLIADILQGGTAWPINLVAIFIMITTRVFR